MHKRIVARLDVKGGNVIKGLQLEGLRVLGEIPEMAARYFNDGADEILILDAVASLYGRRATLEATQEATKEVFIPVTIGGGIQSLQDVEEVFLAGADRVAVNSAALFKPEILREVAQVFGAQAVVVSIEAKEVSNGLWHCFYESGREDSGIKVEDWLASLDPNHVGEILLTSVDRDGTRRGADFNLLDRSAGRSEIPLIYSGGLVSWLEIESTLSYSHVAGAVIGAAFHYGNLRAWDIKENVKSELFTLPGAVL